MVQLSNLPRPNYEYVTNTERARQCMDYIDKYPLFEFDTETTDLDPFKAKISLMQFGVIDKAFVFDVRPGMVDPLIFKPLLEDQEKLKLIQNALFDYKMVKHHYGIEIVRLYDTMLAEQLLTLGLHSKSSLDYIVGKYLNLFMPKDVRDSFRLYSQEFTEQQKAYAANDVSVLTHLYDQQLVRLKQEGLLRAAKMEFEFTKPLAEMELNGITLNVKAWQDIIDQQLVARDNLRIQLSDILNETDTQNTLFGVSLINLDSPSQLVKALHRLGIPVIGTDIKELNKFSDHAIIRSILEYRKYEKFITTYGERMMGRINPMTGRLHTAFRQMVSTGRMSSSNPNLQNIPKEQVYRSCFIAKEGYKLIRCDMSQAELRILAAYSEDPAFLEVYNNGLDLHIRTACDVFGVTPEDIKRDKALPDGDPNKFGYRDKIKAINFGLCTTEDTDIITYDGIKSIVDAKVGDMAAHDIGQDVIIDREYMGKKEVFNLELKYGYSIELTADHLVKVLDESGEYVDKKLSEVDVDNDLVCIKKGSCVFPKYIVRFNKFEVEKATNFKDFELPRVLDEDWAGFLGLFVAEGSLLKVKKRDKFGVVSFGFSKSEKSFISNVDSLFDKLFGDRVSKPKNDYARYSINSVLFGEWLGNICGVTDSDKTNDVKIPDCIKKSPRSVQASFLKWAFEGDGSIKRNGRGYKITYCSKSLGLVKDIQLMLLNFGILSSITTETRQGYDDFYYTLSVVGDKVIFKSEIGFVSDTKNSKFVDNTIYKASSYFVGCHADKIEYIMKNCKVSTQLKERFYKSRFGDPVGDIYLYELAKFDDFFNFMYVNGIVPLPVKSIESKGVKKVYDISVNKHQYFVGNGFILHNCYGLTKVGLALRLGIPEDAAQVLINKYFEKYRKVKQTLDGFAKTAVFNRYIRTISGRKRYFRLPEPSDPSFNRLKGSVERAGKNTPIQGCVGPDTFVEGVGIISEFVGRAVKMPAALGYNVGVVVYSGRKILHRVVFDNGSFLDITLDHKLPVTTADNKLVDKCVSDIVLNEDLVMLYDIKKIFSGVKSVSKVGVESDAYDIIFDKDPHYFYGNGILVHNSNADTMKQGMIYLVDRLEEKGYDAKLLLTVHDEVVVEVREDQAEEVAPLVSQALVDGFSTFFSNVKMEAEALVGDVWLKG